MLSTTTSTILNGTRIVLTGMIRPCVVVGITTLSIDQAPINAFPVGLGVTRKKHRPAIKHHSSLRSIQHLCPLLYSQSLHHSVTLRSNGKEKGSTSRIFFSSSSSTTEEQTPTHLLEQLLLTKLESIGRTDGEELAKAAWTNLQNPTNGYDQRFGRPAIRTYRSFVLPKDSKQNNSKNKHRRQKYENSELTVKQESTIAEDHKYNDKERNAYETMKLEAAAGRTARQIDFLIKRHHSHETEWVRHHDPTILNHFDDQSTIHDNNLISTTSRRQRTFPITIVLDNLRSAMNVGSIFRSAEATGCCQVITCGITPHPNGSGHEKLAKSSLGAERLVSTQHFTTTLEAVESLRQTTTKNNTMTMLALETTERSVDYRQYDYRPYLCPRTSDVHISNHDHDHDESNNIVSGDDYGGGIALILGNEVTGVDTSILNIVDGIIELPTFGVKNSLNVASCAPVVMYEILRQWGV